MREEVREEVRGSEREKRGVREGVRRVPRLRVGRRDARFFLFLFIFLIIFHYIFINLIFFLNYSYISIVFVLTMMIPAGLMFFLPSKNIPKTFKCPGIPLVTHFLSFSLPLLLSSFPFHYKSSLMFSLFLFGLLLQECLSYL